MLKTKEEASSDILGKSVQRHKPVYDSTVIPRRMSDLANEFFG